VATVGVIILHAEPSLSAGELEAWVSAARRALAERHRAGFAAAGATEVRLVAGVPDGRSVGGRLREEAAAARTSGLVVLGSGSIPLATAADRRALVAAAAAELPGALTNNRYSSDVVAIACAGVLEGLPDLPSDNALPRWLAEIAGVPVRELRAWRLRVDVDDALDLVLLRRARPSSAILVPPGIDTGRVTEALDRVAAAAGDRSAEVLVAGRTSSASVAWLERWAAARIRVLIEERGLRASDPRATSVPPSRPRPPASILGDLLDRDGPEALGASVAKLADAALIDTRVLFAHRLGADERRWPPAEDRFASDLLLHERIADAWLAALTRSAAESPVAIVLGGHTLVGPGIRLALR
jgi:hypothetical protein